jgi:hypothetical protein
MKNSNEALDLCQQVVSYRNEELLREVIEYNPMSHQGKRVEIVGVGDGMEINTEEQSSLTIHSIKIGIPQEE